MEKDREREREQRKAFVAEEKLRMGNVVSCKMLNSGYV
jgi:hypothetical protein